MLIISLLAMKLYYSLLAFFVRFWKQMQCIVSQPLPFLVLQTRLFCGVKIRLNLGI